MVDMSYFLLLLIFFSFCLSHSNSENGFQIRFLPRNSHLSPYFDPNLTIQDLLQAEKQRLDYVHFFRSNDDLSLPIGFFYGYYVGEVSVGSSYEKRFLTLDTGSQLIWLQCDPCEICGKKLSPGFNPDNSTTYKSLECDHRICQQNGFYCDEDTETCKFISRYADNDSAIGFLGTDNFHVSTPIVGMSHDILDVIFGCAEEDHRQSWSISDGILGLGLGDESFTSQAKVDRFSYCIPPDPPKDTESYHKMLFGPIANLAGQTTPFRLKGGVYYLRLEGISLLSTRFSIPLIVRNGYMDMAMDSGTTSIWLHPTAYTLLSNALKDALQLTNAYEGCYFGTMKDVNWISITFQFQGGVDVKVPASGIFFESNNKVCTAIYPTQQEWIPSILGLRGQVNYNVGYDLTNKQISFLPTDCSRL